MRFRPALAALYLLPSLAFAADAPATDPKAEEVLTAFAKFFQDAKSFQVQLATTMKVDAKGQKAEMETTYSLSMQRPNSIALVLKSGQMGGSIVSDGTTMSIYLPMLKKYTSDKAPQSLTDVFDPMTQGLIFQGLPFGHEPLFTKDIAADLHENISSITYVGTGEVNGTAASQIKFEARQFTVNLWIASGPQPLLLKSEIALNIAAMPKEISAQMEINEFRRTTLYTDWKINESIPASTFQFQPPAEAEKVDSFLPKGAGGAGATDPLLNKPAPDFTLKDLSGQTVTLSSLRGKIVVLDFWATWCPPCVKGLPIVASVTSAFKDKGVVFYAVNAREDIETITKFLKSKSLDIPVLLDSEGKTMRLYGVQGIPQGYIIDKEGIIRASHRGLSPALEKELTEELTTLSSGGSLSAGE